VETDSPGADDAPLEVVEEEPVEVLAAPTPAAPQPGIVAAPPGGRRLPRVTVAEGHQARVWWLGVHGGAGETTLEQLLPGSRAAGHAWPLTPGVRRGTAGPRVVLVARTDARGLRSAQAAAAEWASGEVPVTLLGLVLVADAPGRQPRPLRELAQLVEGGVPKTWRLPWSEGWRLGEEPDPETAPRAVRDLLGDVAELAPPPAAEVPVPAPMDAAATTQRQEGGAHA
jgi:hypothetical protein